MSLYDNILERLSSESPWTVKNEASVLEPFKFLTDNPGKDIRARLIEAFNQWLHVPDTDLTVITKIVNMLHAASLMVDDIEDDSQLRRGRPVPHKVYGIPQTINSANYVYFLAFQELIALRKSQTAGTPSKDLDAIVTGELLSLHRGQGLDLLWRDSLQCPTEEEYIGMVNNKTGGLLRLGVKLMMACSTTNTDVDYVPLVNLIGVYFQIRDDLMNLQSPEYSSNKGFAEDLTEGKFSFPVIHGIHADTSNRQIMNVLQKRPTTPTLKSYAISYLKDHTKSFDYTLDVLIKLDKQTRAEIQRLGGNTGLEKLMDAFWVDREKLVGSSSK
ncbi:terpenoid synthase [Dendrothele bispora CBS 962.96]|uniref:(2E,6E)-farnesyl diphosphate synthase n=1 Tax=Dendrothele bispora (strain CBS 962.96) TaxID=1314807 RepID=A0A4S8LBT9_DENBC|nr:terpenoid synthase [Dendrothele bispora CBS 962.96]